MTCVLQSGPDTHAALNPNVGLMFGKLYKVADVDSTLEFFMAQR